jgi:hypothetical protein
MSGVGGGTCPFLVTGGEHVRRETARVGTPRAARGGLTNEDSVSNATTAGQILAVSRLALTDAACREVYASAGYEASARNFPPTTLKSDNVFRDDGGIYQLATMAGSVATGYSAGLTVTV